MCAGLCLAREATEALPSPEVPMFLSLMINGEWINQLRTSGNENNLSVKRRNLLLWVEVDVLLEIGHGVA